MSYIKQMTIKGFKKFLDFQVQFNEKTNIIVGENEAGKTTILDALRIVLNQQHRNSDKSILRDLFNAEMVKSFQGNPSIKTLPQIIIEVELELDSKQRNAEYFYGEVYGEKKSQAEKYGIRFECKFDEVLGQGLEDTIAEGKIPYEYYQLTWTTFANNPYQVVKRPIKFISIDTTSSSSSISFNHYNRALFVSKYDERERTRAKNSFREQLEQAFDATELPDIDEKRKFGIDTKKVILETILSIYEESIPLENRGSGMESLIKTKIALDKQSGLDVILMEEPENHLSFSTLRRMLQEISNQQENSQIIIATHSNMIASKLNLNNVLWVTDNHIKSLKDVDNKVATFFMKADDNSFLQLLLSKKAILVEGATEFLLIPYFYQKQIGRTIENDEITVISCNGISFKHYLKIAETTNKRVAVITDNDKKAEKIEEASNYNDSHYDQHVFMSDNVDEWTWEDYIYKKNKKLLDEIITIKKGAQYLFHGENKGQVLGKMLNNKVDTAYLMLTSGKDYIAPQYVRKAVEWLNE